MFISRIIFYYFDIFMTYLYYDFYIVKVKEYKI